MNRSSRGIDRPGTSDPNAIQHFALQYAITDDMVDAGNHLAECRFEAEVWFGGKSNTRKNFSLRADCCDGDLCSADINANGNHRFPAP
jgi:hypothetical protein